MKINVVCCSKYKMGGACGTYGRWEGFRVLVGRPEGKRPLRRPKRRWEDNIKIDFKDIVWGGMDWIGLRIGTSVGLL
jgi:hypothetical protein